MMMTTEQRIDAIIDETRRIVRLTLPYLEGAELEHEVARRLALRIIYAEALPSYAKRYA